MNFNEKELNGGHSLGKHVKCPENIFSHVPTSSLFGVFLCSWYKTVRKIIFSQCLVNLIQQFLTQSQYYKR